ncbi:hypothetical protein [Luteithermobacter gelatinilyticus]|uniref:hypothetical protein n=1 Tax=Luteithermobacter gelatinilyticus TaxID=2582913 RepID=UPI001105A5E2|nr:hypothetical protein [Luteithermobacter gelatinilyticus]
MIVWIFWGWCILLGVAVINGILGQVLIERRFGEYVNHLYKSVVLMAATAGVAWFVMDRSGAAQWPVNALKTGVIWVLATVIFEVVFFRFIRKLPWTRLGLDYKLWEGRLWLVVLLVNLVAPYVAGLVLYG